MGEENKNWFARHRTAVFGIAVAVLILNLVVLVAVPTQTPVELSQTVTEYALADEAFAQAHTLTLTREDGAWHGLSGEASILFSAGKEMDTLLIVLQGSQDVGADVHFLAPGAASRSAALTRLYTYYPAYRTK